MCGIIGFSGSFQETALVDGLQAISHRGPDDSGLFNDASQGVGLGHARLSIIDLSPSGHQPMLSPDGRLVLVFNGEIYNYRELRAELEALGVAFKGLSDTEVLLQLYLRQGPAMIPKLNGIFAFAVWDSDACELFLARDRMGVKPLYLAQTGSGIVFSSEIKGLLGFLGSELEYDAQAIDRYLTYLWCPGDGTPLRNVTKLLPGSAMRIKSGHVQAYWSWHRSPPASSVRKNMAADEAIEGTLLHLRQAVQRQLVADVPVGAFLSGGLDSSAIVALAREQVPEIRCFTIEAFGDQDDGTVDDLPYARRMARHLGVPLDVVTIQASSLAGDLERMVWQLDEPLADPACLNVLYICEQAKRNGIKVLLSGAGGDDVFSGYRRHQALAYERFWDWLPKPAKRLIADATGLLDQRSALCRRLHRTFQVAGLEGDARIASYFAWATRSDLLPLYSPAFRDQLRDATERPMLDWLAEQPADGSKLERMLALEQRFFLADHNLVYTDKMSLACGVEVRVPFLDNDLVDFAATVPDRFKQRGWQSKWVLKKAMEPLLPREVIYRPKTGFGAPLRFWMRHNLREMLGDLLSEVSISRRGLFDSSSVQSLIAANDSGNKDASYTLLSLMCIEIWFRKFYDRPIC